MGGFAWRLDGRDGGDLAGFVVEMLSADCAWTGRRKSEEKKGRGYWRELDEVELVWDNMESEKLDWCSGKESRLLCLPESDVSRLMVHDVQRNEFLSLGMTIRCYHVRDAMQPNACTFECS